MSKRKRLIKPAQIDDYLRDLILRHGKSYRPQVLPPDLVRMNMNQCFDNCLAQTFLSDKYGYVEGIATVMKPDGTIEATAHAWITDGVNAFDPTWLAERGADEVPMPATYVGVELDALAVAGYVMATGQAGVIANRTLKPGLYEYVLKQSRKLWEVRDDRTKS